MCNQAAFKSDVFYKGLSSCRNFLTPLMKFVGSRDFSSLLATSVNKTSICRHWVFLGHNTAHMVDGHQLGNLFPLVQSQTWFPFSLPYSVDHVTCSVHFYTLNMEAVFSEMFVRICQPTCHYIPDHIIKLKLIYYLQKHCPCLTPFLVSECSFELAWLC